MKTCKSSPHRSFDPVALETDLEAHLGMEWPDELVGLPVHGRLDRIDANNRDHRLRVIDYKFKRGRERDTRDKNLVRSAMRGTQLQPPIYALLAANYARAAGFGPHTDIAAAFYYLAPRWEEGPLATSPFSASVWREPAGEDHQADRHRNPFRHPPGCVSDPSRRLLQLLRGVGDLSQNPLAVSGPGDPPPRDPGHRRDTQATVGEHDNTDRQPGSRARHHDV